MKYEVYNPAIATWRKVTPSIYRFLTKERGYQGRKTKPVPEPQEDGSEESEPDFAVE
jgi:hypothetical protein